MIILVIWIGCAILCAVIAASKNRSAIGWFLIGLLFGVFALLLILILGDPTPQTIIINNTVAATATSDNGAELRRVSVRAQEEYERLNPPQVRGGWPGNAPAVDTSRWSAKDRAAYEKRMGEPKLIEAAARPAAPRHDGYEMKPAVVALKVLAEAGEGFNDSAVDAVMTYLEVENGDAEYSRREAQALMDWMRALPSDDETIREALTDLQGAVITVAAFLAAMGKITGPQPADRQGRWVAFLRKRLGA